MLKLLSFPSLRPLFVLVYIAVSIAFFRRRESLGLWNASIIAVWTILSLPLNRPYVNVSFDFVAELVIDSIKLILFIGILVVIIIRLLNKSDRQRTGNIKLLKFIFFLLYGILAAYFSFWLITDIWHNYQPAWHAYSTIFAGAILAIVSCFLSSKYTDKYRFFYRLKDLSIFIYSFASLIIIALVANLIFPIAAIQQTKKIIQEIGDRDTKYCIQSNRKPMNNWLYLTPVTAWNKPNRRLGATTRHAVLVVEKHNKYILYHWSYKLRKWEFNSVGFEPGAFVIPSSLKCTPKSNYLHKLPF